MGVMFVFMLGAIVTVMAVYMVGVSVRGLVLKYW